MTTICRLCEGNDYIKIKQVWEDTRELKKIWHTEPCPSCVPITENDIELNEVRKAGL